jgi:hypothetical protein
MRLIVICYRVVFSIGCMIEIRKHVANIIKHEAMGAPGSPQNDRQDQVTDVRRMLDVRKLTPDIRKCYNIH